MDAVQFVHSCDGEESVASLGTHWERTSKNKKINDYDLELQW